MSAEPEQKVELKPIAIKVMVAIILVWLIKGIELFFAIDLSTFGVYPRDLAGIRGIAFAPMIHGSFEHLFSNTMALFILVTALFYQYPRLFLAENAGLLHLF